MKNKFSRWDTNMIVAVSAVFIGICALFVSIVQTNLQRKQSYAAAWPYLEIRTDMLDNQFFLLVKNKGVGPAIIKRVELTYKGKIYTSSAQLAKEITGKHEGLSYYWDKLEKRVIAPQEEIQFLLLPMKEDAIRFFYEMPHVKLKIAYASVYEQLWIAFENQDVIEITRIEAFEELSK